MYSSSFLNPPTGRKNKYNTIRLLERAIYGGGEGMSESNKNQTLVVLLQPITMMTTRMMMMTLVKKLSARMMA